MQFFYILVDVIGIEQILKCDNSVNAPNCLWQRQDYYGRFVDIQPNGAKYSNRINTKMTIKNVDSRDSGVYRCRLFWDSGTNRYSSPIELSK